MHFDDLLERIACLLVHAVDVLRHQRVQLAAALERHKRAMAGVRFGVPRRMVDPPLPGGDADRAVGHVIVDVGEALGRRILRPDTLRPAKIGNAGFSRNAGARQRDDAGSPVDPAADHINHLSPSRDSPS